MHRVELKVPSFRKFPFPHPTHVPNALCGAKSLELKEKGLNF
jgi:hypothetical protein